MSVTLKGVSRGAGEGHVRTDRAEFIASLDYDNETFLVSLTDPDGAFAYLWNLPCPEYDDRRWARYVFEGNEHTLRHVQLRRSQPAELRPRSRWRPGRWPPRYGVGDPEGDPPPRSRPVHATNNELCKAGIATRAIRDQTGTRLAGLRTMPRRQCLLPGDLNWTVSLAAYERVQQLLGRSKATYGLRLSG